MSLFLRFSRASSLLHLAVVTVTTAALLVPTRAYADACDDSCDSDRPPCSVEERCPDSGVECYEEDDQAAYDACVAKAKADGLELRCEHNSEIYCDPKEEIHVEEEGCALRSPKRPAGGVGLAAVTFAGAAAAMLLRARRRRQK
jgi:hypothetical protein